MRRQQEHGGCEIALKIATVLEQARHDCSRLFSDNLVAGRTRATYCADDHETTVEESEGHARQSEHSAKPVSATWPVSETPGPNVLIVEDDALLGRSLCQVVSLHGIPLVVGTSREACALLSGMQQGLDVAIVDLLLPDGNGLENPCDCTTAIPGRTRDSPNGISP